MIFAVWIVRFLVRSSYMQLWYLLGCVYALACIRLFLKRNWKKQIFVLAAVCYNINVVLTSYNALLPERWHTRLNQSEIWDLVGGNNRLLFGMLFILLGIKLSGTREMRVSFFWYCC